MPDVASAARRVAEEAKASRVEHWRGALWAAIHAQNPFYASVLNIDRIVEAAMALADAEGAARAEAGWQGYLKAASDLHEDAWDDGRANRHESGTTIESREALDAAARRLAGLPDP